jgi:hypothetical protein
MCRVASCQREVKSRAVNGHELKEVSKGPHMRMRLVLLFSLLLGQLVWAQALVIKRVTVIDATGKPAQPDMTVVIAADRIVTVSPWKKAKIPKDAHVVDGSGKFLIPGLWDMHMHHFPSNRAAQYDLLYLANGVLGVREMFGPSNAASGAPDRQRSISPPRACFLPVL